LDVRCSSFCRLLTSLWLFLCRLEKIARKSYVSKMFGTTNMTKRTLHITSTAAFSIAAQNLQAAVFMVVGS
jgi:hypothetical protein